MCKNPQMKHKYSSPDGDDDAREDQMHSCWGRFKLVFSRSRNQRKLKDSSSNNNNNSSSFISFPFLKSTKRGKQSEAFRYSPLSYAQNFDDGIEWETDDPDFRGFTSRYAAPDSIKS